MFSDITLLCDDDFARSSAVIHSTRIHSRKRTFGASTLAYTHIHHVHAVTFDFLIQSFFVPIRIHTLSFRSA